VIHIRLVRSRRGTYACFFRETYAWIMARKDEKTSLVSSKS
jgi:hypothetical protein